MSPVDPASATAAAEAGLEITKNVKPLLDRLGPYKPEVKSLRINYLGRTAELKLLINVPQGFKRKIRDVEIPAYEGYQVTEVFDETFNPCRGAWVLEDNKFKFDAAKLPASENYFVVLKSPISKETLGHLVVLNAPKDPLMEEKEDKYWVHSAIKDMTALARIYDELAIDEVDVNVVVGVRRDFSTSIPKDIVKRLEALSRFIRAADRKDRNEFARARYAYQAAKRTVRASEDEIIDALLDLVSKESFIKYLDVEPPYRLHDISPERRFKEILPAEIEVNVLADLNYRRPVADGHLVYKKQQFREKIKEATEKLL